ncbi:MAG: hypothetical protein PHF63_02190 [Herbinix sp.]|nr:hypothetical protein [Herbinix sp.]
MKFKIVILIFVIIGIILTPVLLYNLGNRNFTKERIYDKNWDIHIPSDFKIIYHNQDQHDFQGDGRRYTIFVTKETSFLPIIYSQKNAKEIQTIDGCSSDGRNYDIEEFVQAITTDLKIPENYIPKFEEYYVWQKFVNYGNTLVVFYFPGNNKVYFIEKLM